MIFFKNPVLSLKIVPDSYRERNLYWWI